VRLGLPDRRAGRRARSGPTRSGAPTSPRLPERAGGFRARCAGEGGQNGGVFPRTGDRDRGGHDGKYADPCRCARRAVGDARGVPCPVRGLRVALEGPHRARRGHKDHRVRPAPSTAVPGQVRGRLFLGMVLVQGPSLPSRGARRLRGGPHVGRVRRLDPGGADRPNRDRPLSPLHLRRRPQGDVPPVVGRISGRGVPCRGRSGAGPRSADPAVGRGDDRRHRRRPDGGMGRAARIAPGDTRRRRRVRRPPRRGRVGHRAGDDGEDPRHVELRHGRRPAVRTRGRHPRAYAGSSRSPSCPGTTASRRGSPRSATSTAGSSSASGRGAAPPGTRR